MSNTLGTVLQENLLVLLCFDPKNGKIIRNAVEPGLFTGIYRDVAERAYDYIDRYNDVPADHLPDLLSDKLESQNKREITLFEDLLYDIKDLSETINADYTMTKLETFVTRQSLRSVSVDLIKSLQDDTEESIKAALTIIHKATKSSLKIFNPGTRLSDADAVLHFLEVMEAGFPTGIPELDRIGFGPTRKELLLYVGRYKSGKSWFLIQVAKMALVHQLKVLHITLEMSEARCAQRYMQAIFSCAKRGGTYLYQRLFKDRDGKYDGFEIEKVYPSMTFDDPKIAAKLRRKIKKFATRYLENLIIKEFPTGQLTMQDLEAYLDNLETTTGFVPDVILWDYPDLMKLDPNNIRGSLDEMFKNGRGLAVKRNLAMVTVSQSHRAQAKAKVTGGEGVAEHYGKVMHADGILTYSQTEAEKELGLARLRIDGGRNDVDGLTIVISQNYAVGQFCLSSALMHKDYWKDVKRDTPESD